MGLISTADCKVAICSYLKDFLVEHRGGIEKVEQDLLDYTRTGVWKRMSKTKDSFGNTFRMFEAPMCGEGKVSVVERDNMIVTVKWLEGSGPAAFDFIQPNAGDFEAKQKDDTPKPGNWGSFA
ncbi:hypothetical protein hairong_118 [Pseudomonas phage hairong]|nr:hypothetical protein hairong_118 [Pseudomonas phage hairong]